MISQIFMITPTVRYLSVISCIKDASKITKETESKQMKRFSLQVAQIQMNGHMSNGSGQIIIAKVLINFVKMVNSLNNNSKIFILDKNGTFQNTTAAIVVREVIELKKYGKCPHRQMIHSVTPKTCVSNARAQILKSL